MFKFSKSLGDFEIKTDSQHKTLCDWLRTVDYKITVLQKSIAEILENESQADIMARDLDDK